MKMMNKASNRTKNNLKGVHPDLIMVITYALAISEVDFFVNEGVRTLQRQQELYAQGRTVKGSIVTNVDGVSKKSNHQVKSDGYGHAVDIYQTIWNNKIPNSDPSWEKMFKAIKTASLNLGIPVTIGAYWTKFIDFPHIQLGERNWK